MEINSVKKFTWIVRDRVYWERVRDAIHTPQSQDRLKRYKEWLTETERADDLPNKTQFILNELPNEDSTIE